MVSSMQDKVEKTGFTLSDEDSEKVKTSLSGLKKRFRTARCRDCDEEITFSRNERDGKTIPYSLDGNEHWKSCPYSTYSQRRAAPGIMKKLAILFVHKYGINIDSEANLTRKETQIVLAALEKAFRSPKVEVADTPGEVIDNNSEEDIKKDLKELEVSIPPCPQELPPGDDPVGDPDEDLAPSEDVISEEDCPSE